MGGTKNPLRERVAQDIVSAVLKSPATGRTPAVYWDKNEQEVRMEKMYKKWRANGKVWSEAAAKVRLC